MGAQDVFAACETIVRRADPDRYFSTLFAPADRRLFLFALYAFNHEIARIGEVVREPMMGEIRLQWWREGIADARAGKPRPHDVLRALAQTFSQTDLPLDLFDSMLEARSFDFANQGFDDKAARDAYIDSTSGTVMRLASRTLGAGNSLDVLAYEAGLAYGLVGLLRSRPFHAALGKVYLRDPDEAARDAAEHLDQARRLGTPSEAIVAFLPAALVPLYLRNLRQEVPLYRKLLTLYRAARRRRL